MRLKHVFYLFILYCTHLFVCLVSYSCIINFFDVHFPHYLKYTYNNYSNIIILCYDMELCLQYIAPIDQRDHKLYAQLAAWTHLLKLKVHNLYIPTSI